MSVKTITPSELAERCQAGPVTLLDVRTPAEFQEVHVPFAENLPLDQLKPERLTLTKDAELFVICRSGSRGQQACEKLVKAGFTKVCNVLGGTLAWDQAGLPVVRGRAVMSLERQVRIAAGMLILLGVGLGFAVHPGFFGLSAFVGAGLVFAGVTNTCGMGMMLARMPWNRRRKPTTCSVVGGQS